MNLALRHGLPKSLGILLQYNPIPEKVKDHRTFPATCHSFEKYDIIIYFFDEILLSQVLLNKELQTCDIDWQYEIQNSLQLFFAENFEWKKVFRVFHLHLDLVFHDCVLE